MDPAELPRYNKGGDIKGSIPDSATSPMEAAKEGQVHHVDDGIGIAAHYHSPLHSSPGQVMEKSLREDTQMTSAVGEGEEGVPPKNRGCANSVHILVTGPKSPKFFGHRMCMFVPNA